MDKAMYWLLIGGIACGVAGLVLQVIALIMFINSTFC